LVRLGLDTVFTSDFLGRVDREGPKRSMRSVYDTAQAGSLINRMLAYDFQFTLADSDLPKVVKSCELAGLPVDFPMLDDPLVNFSARLTPQMKLKGTQLRYFFKESLRGFLPDAIITKSKHGFGLPFGPWIRSHKPLEELVLDNLGSLRGRGFIRADFIDQLMGSHLREHAGYYGTMAWVLVMLELWFRETSIPTE
jgi:asparagine synthase (glutamine-hydrolysing)